MQYKLCVKIIKLEVGKTGILTADRRKKYSLPITLSVVDCDSDGMEWKEEWIISPDQLQI